MPYSTFGTLLKRGDGEEPEVFATIAGLGDVDEVSSEIRMAESTSHDSGGWVERTPLLLDAGDLSCVIRWNPSDPTHALLKSDHINMVKRNYQIVETFPGGETADFAAYVQKIGKPYPVEGLLEATVVFSNDGPRTWA